MQIAARTSNSKEYRYGFNGKEKDEDGEFGSLTHYDYGFRIYNPGIGRFLSVDPLTQSYPWYTPYQFASDSPIANIDLDGLEATLAIYGIGKNKGDSPQFKKDADYDVKMKASTSSHKIVTGQKLIELLRNETKHEGSIGRIAIFSHSTPHGIYLDDTPGNYGGILRSVYKGLNKKKGYKNTIIVSDLVQEIKSKKIKFEKNSIVIFTGCNTASKEDNYGVIKGKPIAKNFTMLTGIKSIGAVGGTMPDNDGTASRTADNGYYLFERIKDESGNYSILSTFLSKSLNPTDYKYKVVLKEIKPLKKLPVKPIK